MLGRVDGSNSFLSTTLISTMSKEKRTKWLTHLEGECMNYMLSMYQTYIKGRILEAANADLQYMELVAKLQQDEMLQRVENYELRADGTLLYKSRVYVPNVQEFKLMILKEMHSVPLLGNLNIRNFGNSQEPLLLARYEERYF
jgi:hypothetical protein